MMIVIPSLSCVPGKPYEVKSPCVSIDSLDEPGPCSRRPVNLTRDIV